MTNRDLIESTLIAQIACFNGAYQQVGDILSPSSFRSKISGIPCEIYYKACTLLYPTKPIDVVTVIMKVCELLPNESTSAIAYALMECNRTVMDSSNLRYHAACLIDICVKDEFVSVLSKIDTRDDAVLQETIKEMHVAIQMGHDVYDVIDKSHPFLLKQGYEKESNSILALSNAVTKKIQAMKRKSQIQTLLTNIDSLNLIRPDKKEELQGHILGIIKLLS